MAQKRSKSKRGLARIPLWSAIAPDARRRVLRIGMATLAVVIVAAGMSLGLDRLDAHVDDLLVQESAHGTFTFVDLPQSLVPLAGADLEASLEPVQSRTWTDAAICEDIASAVASVGWIERVASVRRNAGGRFEIRADYRKPAAMIQLDEYFLLIDRTGVRLPGRYAYDPRWSVLQGVSAPAPEPGNRWPGDDVQAGLATLEAVAGEPFSTQVTGVLVHNFAGRRDPRATHIELATDRPGGRIRWGSAPGREVEENLVPHKLAILRHNFARTGRLDAGCPVIDVSTFPDRFTVPN